MNNEQKYKINEFFCSAIHEVCSDFAVNNMIEKDFVRIQDAYGNITEGIKIERSGEPHHLYTIKRSYKKKYIDLYNKKLKHIIEKLLKDHA